MCLCGSCHREGQDFTNKTAALAIRGAVLWDSRYFAAPVCRPSKLPSWEHEHKSKMRGWICSQSHFDLHVCHCTVRRGPQPCSLWR